MLRPGRKPQCETRVVFPKQLCISPISPRHKPTNRVLVLVQPAPLAAVPPESDPPLAIAGAALGAKDAIWAVRHRAVVVSALSMALGALARVVRDSPCPIAAHACRAEDASRAVGHGASMDFAGTATLEASLGHDSILSSIEMPNYNSVSEYAELCSAAKAAGCRSLSGISTSVPLAHLPVLPVTCRLTRAPGAAVFFSATPRRIPSAYPGRHSRERGGLTH